MAENLMIMSTHSGVGKNFIASGVARVFRNHGIRAIPFKGCAIENYTCTLPNGERIAYSQAIQCRAAGMEPTCLNNPIVGVFSPGVDQASEILVNGRPHLIENWRDYWASDLPYFKEVIAMAIAHLRRTPAIIMAEGAGSPVELGLEAIDLPNITVARELDARILIATEMCFGGGYAHIVGTYSFLPDDIKDRVIGFVLNKFPATRHLQYVREGVAKLEQCTGIPVLGLLPVLDHCPIPSEVTFSNVDLAVLESANADFDSLAEFIARHFDLVGLFAKIGIDVEPARSASVWWRSSNAVGVSNLVD